MSVEPMGEFKVDVVGLPPDQQKGVCISFGDVTSFWGLADAEVLLADLQRSVRWIKNPGAAV